MSLKFARVALELFAHEGTFDIGFDSQEELGMAVKAFQEIGCAAEPHPYRPILTVSVPAS